MTALIPVGKNAYEFKGFMLVTGDGLVRVFKNGVMLARYAKLADAMSGVNMALLG